MRSCFTVAGLPRTKRLALAILISMLATESLAISRYEVGNKSCGELHAIVRRDGAAILRWRSQRTGNPLYERFVRNWNYCPAGQTTAVAQLARLLRLHKQTHSTQWPKRAGTLAEWSTSIRSFARRRAAGVRFGCRRLVRVPEMFCGGC